MIHGPVSDAQVVLAAGAAAAAFAWVVDRLQKGREAYARTAESIIEAQAAEISRLSTELERQGRLIADQEREIDSLRRTISTWSREGH